jgi:hypothetical protein
MCDEWGERVKKFEKSTNVIYAQPLKKSQEVCFILLFIVKTDLKMSLLKIALT